MFTTLGFWGFLGIVVGVVADDRSLIRLPAFPIPQNKNQGDKGLCDGRRG